MVLPYTHHQLCSSPWMSMIQMQLIVFIASYTLSVFTALTGSTYYIWTPIKLLFRNASSLSSVTPFCMLIHVLPLSPVMDHYTLLSVEDGTFSVMESPLLNGLNCLTFVGQVSLLSFAGVEVLSHLLSHCSISLAEMQYH